MLHTKNVPGQFWTECMKTTAYIINRLPQPKLGFVSPFEKLWKIKPTVKHFRVFGCVCYVFVPDQLRSKFDKKALQCIFLGYDNERKGWKCCDPLLIDATPLGMLYSMKHHHGGHKKLHYQDPRT